ncbi:MAG: AAA family ATPase [Selenomonadaceae bacterium]|nr:AAA family ATPase [Selenomonadaceae bacterium]
MIRKIHITQYRKLNDLDLEFTPGLNGISGTNGTCKTSLLHLFSNSLQAVTSSCNWLNDKKCLQVINAVNAVTNPKVETLTRGDKKYNDPAHGVSGVLFNVDYWGEESLGFRRHNSPVNTRYAIKPLYKRGAHEKLPYCPVVYLGLSRLVPYGEFQNDEAIEGIRRELPIEYQNEINELYRQFTHYEITYSSAQQMGDLKTRAEFSSNSEGIDSNTISAGEDNLYIILVAIVSLKYYYQSIRSQRKIESVLLVDELDATLHPAYQIKVLRVLRKYCEDNKIQAVFTTHSMAVIKDLLEKKDNVIYLLDNITNVAKMDAPDFYKIKMHLSSLTRQNIYQDKIIPIFTEDEEARCLLRMMLDYFVVKKPEEFAVVHSLLYLVGVSIGADSLTGIFKDSKMLRMTMGAICVLDGDHDSDISSCIVALPGKNEHGTSCKLSPELLLLDYARIIYDADDAFWTDPVIVDKGYGKPYYLEHIYEPWMQFSRESENGETNKKRRVFVKELFNAEKTFFELLFKHWLHNEENRGAIYKFYCDLKKLFKKVAMYNEINPNEWK